MNQPPAPQFFLASTQREWDEAVPRLLAELKNRPLLAIDTEADGFFRYPEHVCLIQLKAGRQTIILDPFGVDNPSPLAEVFEDSKVEKVFHACDYDLRILDREFQCRFHNLFDTYIAAQLLAPETPGLGGALQSRLGVTIEKKVKLQRSDWSKRPLRRDALEYAALDVEYLEPLRDNMHKELAGKGRLKWAEEEFAILEGIRFDPPPPPEEACFSAKGTFDLSPEELAIFRELFIFRDAEARRLDRPPFKVAGNDFLLALARNPRAPLHEFTGINRGWLERAERSLRDAISRGMRAGPLQHPSRGRHRPNPWREDSSARWRALKEARQLKATELNLAPSTIWPGPCLDQMALDSAVAERELGTGPSEFGVRAWQREVVGPVLRKALAGGPA